jgi:hypothetical protein
MNQLVNFVDLGNGILVSRFEIVAMSSQIGAELDERGIFFGGSLDGVQGVVLLRSGQFVPVYRDSDDLRGDLTSYNPFPLFGR